MSKKKNSKDDDLNIPNWDKDEDLELLQKLENETNLNQLADPSFDELNEMLSNMDINLDDLLSDPSFDKLNELLSNMDTDLGVLDELLSKMDTDLGILDELADNANIDISLVESASNGDLDDEDTSHIDPNLTDQDVAQWMLEQIQEKKILYQSYAASYIRKHFGSKFVYKNENSNLAISRKVLGSFLRISFPIVVWSRRKLYWRLRTSTDNPKTRSVIS